MRRELYERGLTNWALHLHTNDDGYKSYLDAVEHLGQFDLVIIDGRERVECVRRTRSHVRSEGYLLIDNAERERYAPIVDMLRDWVVTPTSNGLWRTDIYQNVRST